MLQKSVRQPTCGLAIAWQKVPVLIVLIINWFLFPLGFAGASGYDEKLLLLFQ